ncbi:hypothetical protein QQ045_020061 [Rhodiola kirilowii]
MRSGAHIAGLGCRDSNNTSLAEAGMILLWIFLFLSQLGLCHSLDANKYHHLNQHQQHLNSGNNDQLIEKLASRKLHKIVQQKLVSGSFKAAPSPSQSLLPPEQSQFVNGDGSEVVYEDDKRRVHTGPNPLHN